MPFPNKFSVGFSYKHPDGNLTRIVQQLSVPAPFENKSESMTHQQNKYVGLWCVVRQAHDFDAISAFMFYHHDFPFQFMMLSSYPSNLFLLSRRGSARDTGPCPVSISSLCEMHNIVANFRFNNPDGGDLTKDTAFNNLCKNWGLYQKKYDSRTKFMKQAPRIYAVLQDREIVNLPASCALLGTLSDLAVGGKTDKPCSSFSCSLRPERDNSSPPIAFSDLYAKRCTTYNETKLNKITVDQLINFQLLVRKEIQYLASCDVEWQPSSGKNAEGGANSTGPRPEDPACSAATVSEAAERQPVAAEETQHTTQTLSLLQPIPSANAAGSVASAEYRLLRYALRVSKLDSTSLNGEECHGEACFPTAGLSGAQSLDSTEVEGDIFDIVHWGYSRGDFPLTRQGLLRMEFDHDAHRHPPKYVFPAAILLFVCAKRSVEEEDAYQRLCKVWRYWFDTPLSYVFLKEDPPLRLNLNPEEIEWCKVKLDYLVKQISSDSDRERLGLPTRKLTTREKREQEASLLINHAQARPDTNPAPRDDPKADTSAKLNAAPAPRAAAAASGSDSVNGGDDNAEKKGGGNVKMNARRKRKHVDGDAAVAPAAAKLAKGAQELEGGSPVKDEEKITVRESDGKKVSLKDGRIVAAGNDLKKQFPNTYRNADNERTFHGKHLNLGEAFKLACLVQYGPNLPIEQSGHNTMRTALFRTAAYYALSDEELKQILEDPLLADFLFFLVKCAKQIMYTLGVEARLIFGDSVFSRHPPAKLLRGTSNIISVHYAVTVFSNPLFSMQSIWAWKPRQPSWIARIG